jgi:serine O-acetyltransferase
MAAGDLLRLVRSDLHRYRGRTDLRTMARSWLVNPGFRYTATMRTVAYLSTRRGPGWAVPQVLAKVLLRRLSWRFGIQIPAATSIGPGLYLGHYHGIVVNCRAVIGRNCNLSQGVTIGQVNRGCRAGCPTLGDNVYVGPGASIIGTVTVGDDAAIGANCVVTRDVPPGAVVVGVPGRVVSQEGSTGYIQHTDYATV